MPLTEPLAYMDTRSSSYSHMITVSTGILGFVMLLLRSTRARVRVIFVVSIGVSSEAGKQRFF